MENEFIEDSNMKQSFNAFMTTAFTDPPNDHLNDSPNDILEMINSELSPNNVPNTDIQITDVPNTDVQITDIQITDVPNTDVPNTDVPNTDVQITDVPNTDVPNTDVPKMIDNELFIENSNNIENKYDVQIKEIMELLETNPNDYESYTDDDVSEIVLTDTDCEDISESDLDIDETKNDKLELIKAFNDENMDEEVKEEEVKEEEVKEVPRKSIFDILKMTPGYRKDFKILTDEEKPDGIVGLLNLGNTCYMNSVLQCLSKIIEFKELMLDPNLIRDLYPNVIKKISDENKKNYSVILTNTQKTLAYQMYKLMNVIWGNKTKHIRPVNFIKIFSKKIVGFQVTEQQDAQEALICILDTIHTELESNVDINYNFFSPEYLKYFEQIEERKLSDIDCCKLENQYENIWELLSVKRTLDQYNKKSYSLITQLFQNLISSKLECPKCNYHSYNFDPMINIQVSIPKNKEIDMTEINDKVNKIPNITDIQRERIKQHLISNKLQSESYTLDECFQNLTHIETLDDSNLWLCPHCDVKVNAYKQINIWIPSPIMIIHIKRFIHEYSNNRYTSHKLNNTINYPINDFNINPYMSEYPSKLGNFTYDLFGVVNHTGHINGGHYYAFAKSQTDNKWYCMDDDTITLIDDDKLVSSNAYLLFYKLKSN